MSNSYGFTMKGPLILEKLASLPTWTPNDEGRLIYNTSDKELYMGTSYQWERKESDGYSATDSSFSNNDPLIAGTIYFIDTTSSSLTGVLPESPSTGQVVTIVDNNGNFKTNPFYINGNGNNIMGSSTLTLNTKDVICKLIFNGSQWITDIGGTLSSIGGGTSSTGGVGNVVNISSNYTANDNDFIFANSSYSIQITLPNTGLADGSAVSVYDQSGSFITYPCTVNGNGNNIMGKSTMKIKTNFAKVDFIWNTVDSEWKTVYSTAKLNNSINVVNVSSNYSAEVDDFIMADTTAGAFSITLPTSGYLIDKSKITVIDQTGFFGTNSLNIIPSDGTIDGSNMLVCDTDGLKVDLVWDKENSQWKVDLGGSNVAATSSTYENWIVKTESFFAVAKRKYIVDTTSSPITVTLPESADNGDGILFADGGDFAVNSLTVARNNNTIEGLEEDMTVDTSNQSFELVFYNNNWILA